MNKTTLLFLLFNLLLFSCAQQKVQKTYQDPTYSDDIEKEFSNIEMSDSQKLRIEALERYRLLREERINKKRSNRSTPSYRPKKITYAQPVEPQKPKRRIIHTDPQEMAIEIEQKLTFYCMKNRKSSRFSQEGSCQEFTDNTLLECKNKFEDDDKNLLYCVEKTIR